MTQIGRCCWAIAGGHIPLRTTGREPDYTSNDTICVLNTTDAEAALQITVFYADREPIGPYRLIVLPRRVRQVWFNDLIDPEAIPLDTDYAFVVESTVPVVVQFSRRDTSRAENAIATTLAYPVD
jgi:hypothetical protein